MAVLTEVVVPKPKTTKRKWPVGDNDNFEKATWDAVTSSERFWSDDDQIVFNCTWKRFAGKHETPGTRLYVYALEETP